MQDEFDTQTQHLNDDTADEVLMDWIDDDDPVTCEWVC